MTVVNRSPRGLFASVDPEPQRASERCLLQHLDDDSGADAEIGEVAQRGADLVVDAVNSECGAGLDAVEVLAPLLDVTAGGRRYRVTVRVGHGVAEEVVDAGSSRSVMVCSRISVGVHLVPWHVEDLEQVRRRRRRRWPR